MRQNHIILLMSACVLLLSSCASGPGFAEAQASFPKLASNQGRLFVYRTNPLGAAIQPMIMVDGKEAGRAKAKGFVLVDLPPGAHKVQVKTEVSREATVNVSSGQNSYVRLDVNMGIMAARITPVVIPSAQGASEVATCKKVQ